MTWRRWIYILSLSQYKIQEASKKATGSDQIKKAILHKIHN